MFTVWESNFVENQRVARLTTIDTQGWPHTIPIVFGFDGKNFFTPLDDKPKRVRKERLQRVLNINYNNKVAIIFDVYDENWNKLAWVLIRGNAEILNSGPEYAKGVSLLNSKYSQYKEMPLSGSQLICVQTIKVTSWRMS